MEETERRLREMEVLCATHEGRSQERWKMQFLFNEKIEERLDDMETCVQKISTNLKVNTVKITAIFVAVQIVITAFAIAIVRSLLGS